MFKIFDGKTGFGCIKAIVFDMFGTVVDWRGTMVKTFKKWFDQKGIKINCDEFIQKWVNAYSDNMSQLSEGNGEFKLVDELNEIALNNTLLDYGILDLFTDEERNQMWLVWHELKPWPDSVSGINHLKEHIRVGTLSNGNVSLLEDISRNALIDWDIILSGEMFRCYKPNPMVYINAAQKLNLQPSEIMLVASHKYDLFAAQQLGFKTAYIFRPLEFQALKEDQQPKDDEFDFVVDDIEQLAETLIGNKLDNNLQLFSSGV